MEGARGKGVGLPLAHIIVLSSEDGAGALAAVDVFANVANCSTEVRGVICSEEVNVECWIEEGGMGDVTWVKFVADGSFLGVVVVECGYAVDLVCADCEHWPGFGGDEGDAAGEGEEKE